MTSMDLPNIRLSTRTAIAACLLLAVAILMSALPALAQEPPEDPDGTREGAVSLGNQSPGEGRQFFRSKSLDRANGDAVDYYTFTIDGRYELGLGVRDQSIDLDSWLEDAEGNAIVQSGPPADRTKDQTIEWLKTTIKAGTYYIRVQAMEDGQTGYYLRFGLSEPPPNSAPTFGYSSYDFSIAEDAATGDAVGDVSATDADSDTLAYTIESGNEDGTFAISSTGAITTAGVLDHETDASYALTVQADDGNGGAATATVNITVTDVEESTAGPLSGFSLVDASDQAVLATLGDGGSVELDDPNGGSYGLRADLAAGETAGSVRLELSGARTASRTENVAPYSLHGDSGEDALRGGSLPAGSYTLTATAYEDSSLGGDELGTLAVSFTITKANSAPEFGSATYSFSIAEDAATGDAVGDVSATDADSDTLTYTIESGNEDGTFAISSTGAITTAGVLDHETDASYALTVQADDGNGGAATATVNITVTDVEESTAGPLSGFSLVDASDQAVLATLSEGGSVELDDPDGGSYGLRADLAAGETAGSVRLELSGAKTVTRTENVAPYALYGDSGADALEGESLPAGSYTLTATAYEERSLGGDVLGTLEVSFTVTLGNRPPEFGSATYSFSIAEDAATGDAVGDVSATDADDDTLTYTIESGNEDGTFAISSTGAITTAGELDHETDASYALTVQADDDNGGTDTATVNITVTDVEEPTAGPLSGFSLVDASDQAVLATLSEGGSVELDDPDGGSYGLRADLAAGETAGSVRLELSGAKTVTRTENIAPYALYGDSGADALEGESLPAGSYTLTATAYEERSLGGDVLGTLEVSFTVTLGNRPPEFGSATYSFSIAEDAATGDAVGSVSATDADSDTLTYTIESGNGDGHFAIDGGSGAITIAGALGDESDTSFTLTVQADDGNGGAATATVNVSATGVAEDLTPGIEYGTTPDGVAFMQFVVASERELPVVEEFALQGAVGATEISLGTTGLPARLLPQGLWSDSTTLWVLAQGRSPTERGKLYAFTLSDGSRDSDKDIDLDLPSGSGGATGLWMTDDTVWVSVENGFTVYAFHRKDDTADPAQFEAGDRKSGSDFTLNFRGIFETSELSDLWSDGSSIYVAGHFAWQGDLWRHQLDGSGGRKQVLLAHDNIRPSGVWSDGTVLWVADVQESRVMGYTYRYPYSRYQPYRQMVFDIPVLAKGNSKPRGLWSDGTDMWVGNENSKKVYKYDLPGDPRLGSLSVGGVNLESFHRDEYEYERNVAGDITQVTVEPETYRSDAEVAITPTDVDAINEGHQVTLVENGVTTITVTVTHYGDTQTYTLKLTQLENTTGTLSSDSSLSALSLSGVTLDPTFNKDVTRYFYALTASQQTSGLTTTVTATPGNSNADVHITPADGVSTNTTHDVVTGGKPVVVDIVVTPQDGSDSRHYAVAIRGNTRISRDSSKDISAQGTHSIFDLWSDGETMWVLDPVQAFVKAYDLDTGDAKPEKNHFKGSLGRHGFPRGLWSDGDTLWLAEGFSQHHHSGSKLIKATHMESFIHPRWALGESLVRKETSRIGARDLWSDGETIWVALMEQYGSRTALRNLAYGELRAYDFETKERDADKDIPISTIGRVSTWFDGDLSHGIWSDGTVLWVVSNTGTSASTLEAHKLSDGSRMPGLDVLVGKDGIHRPANMWSNGRTMWVAERQSTNLYAYTLPANAKLFSLEMTDVDFGHFYHGRPKYTAEVANSVSQITVSWVQAHTGGSAAVAITATDKDGNDSTTDAHTDPGYQVALDEGANTIAIQVTAPNGTDTYTYTVTVTRASS